MEAKKNVKKVEDFIVYQKAMELFNNFVEDDLEIPKKTSWGQRIG